LRRTGSGRKKTIASRPEKEGERPVKTVCIQGGMAEGKEKLHGCVQKPAATVKKNGRIMGVRCTIPPHRGPRGPPAIEGGLTEE